MQQGKPFDPGDGSQSLQAILTALQNLVTSVNNVNQQIQTAVANLANPAAA